MERKQRIEKKRKELEVLKALEATLKKRAAAEEEASVVRQKNEKLEASL